MRDRLLLLLLRLLSRTPLRVNQILGAGLGRILWRFNPREKRNSLINLQLCYPEKSLAWQEKTARNAFYHLTTTMLEAPKIWALDREKITALIENPEVLEATLEIYKQGNGLMLAAPHLGNWEVVGQLFGAYTKMTSLYRPPQIKSLSKWIKQARQTTGAELVPTDASGVKKLTKALIKGNCSGILPDQEPEQGSGVYVPFFNHQAYTMILLPRLVRKRKIPVVFIFAERLKNGKYRLLTESQNDNIYDASTHTATSVMNQQVETLINQCPEQYNWAYKRFKSQPDGRDLYKSTSNHS